MASPATGRNDCDTDAEGFGADKNAAALNDCDNDNLDHDRTIGHSSISDDEDGLEAVARSCLALERIPSFGKDESGRYVLIVHVYKGGRNGIQSLPFESAWRDFQRYNTFNNAYVTYDMQIIDSDHVKTNHWSPLDLVEWLLSSHVHFILTHIHQGVSNYLNWNVADLYRELLRLSKHPGFPTGSKLACPIFTQDKYAYIEAVPDLFNPTLKIPLSDKVGGARFSDLYYKIVNFTTSYEGENGKGWIVKAPFTTNGEFAKKAATFEKVFAVVQQACAKYYGILPYVMIQPCVANASEKKVVLVRGEAVSIANIEGKPTFKRDKVDVYQFAVNAMKRLAAECPAAILDGLVRVDLFQKASGELVVNEFESLEAVYYSKCHDVQCHIEQSLHDYWLEKIREVNEEYTENIACLCDAIAHHKVDSGK